MNHCTLIKQIIKLLNQLVEGGQYFVEIEIGGLLNQLVEGGQYLVQVEEISLYWPKQTQPNN